MTDVQHGFDSRLRSITRKRARLERGYVGKIRRDGLIVFKPRRQTPTVPLRGLIYLVLGFVFFKAVVLAHLGAVTYEERLLRLQDGNLIEQAGAAIMQSDPLTRIMAQYLSPVLR